MGDEQLYREAAQTDVILCYSYWKVPILEFATFWILVAMATQFIITYMNIEIYKIQ